MYKLAVFILVLSFLPSCRRQPKKLIFDPRTQIDCLPEDEYGSDRERVHAKDIVRFHEEEQNRIEQIALHKSSTNALVGDDRIALFEAKLGDIPIPIESKPIQEYFDAADLDTHEIVLGYTSEQSLDELIQFYQTAMIQFNWHLVCSFMGSEQMFIFEKSDQMCVISLRMQEGWFYQGGHTQIIIFVAVILK